MLDSPLPFYDDFATHRIAVIPTLAQSTLIAIFAIAFPKRHLWAAYGLITIASVDAVLRAVAFGAVPVLFSLFFIFAYWTGSHSLRRMDHIAPRLDELNSRRIIWLGIICVVGHWALYFVCGIAGLHRSVPDVLSVGWDAGLISYLLTKEDKYTFESVIGFWISLVIIDLVVGSSINATFLEQNAKMSVQIVGFLLRHVIVLLPLGLILWGISEAARWLASQRGSKKVGASL
jgi:hypothetical protein